MEKDFLPYEESYQLMKLGYNEPCLKYTPILMADARNPPFESDWYVLEKKLGLPLFSQAFRWFREKHNWQNSIDPTADQHSHQLGYNYWIWNYKTGEEHHTVPKNRPSGDWEYETYEEAELACIKKLIQIVKEQQYEWRKI